MLHIDPITLEIDPHWVSILKETGNDGILIRYEQIKNLLKTNTELAYIFDEMSTIEKIVANQGPHSNERLSYYGLRYAKLDKRFICKLEELL